jgi:hypothetical protein
MIVFIEFDWTNEFCHCLHIEIKQSFLRILYLNILIHMIRTRQLYASELYLHFNIFLNKTLIFLRYKKFL